MAKKKKTIKPKNCEFNSDPFNNLKGFSVSRQEKIQKSPEQKIVSQDVLSSFSEEMEMLGVQQLNKDDDLDATIPGNSSSVNTIEREVRAQPDEELFLAAMGDLPVRFKDHFPEDESPLLAVPRRMKQLKQGKLSPDASLDLHGCQCAEVVGKLRVLLQNARHQGWQTLLVITGRGLHSEDGVPILRDEAEKFLSGAGKNFVAEWGRAPKQYGGEGAIILFLRKK
ncbi:MAG: Smr/MutS family protein [Desulfuromusa sp.]